MKEVINDKLPRFNTEKSQKFHKILKELMERSQDEVEERAQQNDKIHWRIHSWSLVELMDWSEDEVCQSLPFLEGGSRAIFTALQTFMTIYHKKLWESILLAAKSGETEYLIKIDKCFQVLPCLTVGSSRHWGETSFKDDEHWSRVCRVQEDYEEEIWICIPSVTLSLFPLSADW